MEPDKIYVSFETDVITTDSSVENIPYYHQYIRKDALLEYLEELKAQQDLWVNRYHDPINQSISEELGEIIAKLNSM